MSKDIWHTAGFHEAIDDKLKVSRDGKMVYWTMYGWNIPGDDAHDIGCDWCYLTDLLALETKLERTRKALKITTDAIDEILYLDSGKFCKEPAEMWKIAKSAKDKITAEQKDNQ